MPPEIDFDELAHRVVPEIREATATIGGSRSLLTADLRHARLGDLLRESAIRLVRPPPPPPPPPLPERLGPFAWNPIVFDNGVPVGGWAQLSLFRSGAFSFAGHFHDSGAPSYDVSCVFAVRDADGTVYTFSHRGRVHGTFESGSRDDDWGDAAGPSGTNQAIAAAWPQLSGDLSWTAKAGADADFRRLFDDAVGAVRTVAGAAAAVIAIV